LIFKFQEQGNVNSIPVKTLLASLLLPIFTLCYAFATRFGYKGQEAVADRQNRAICSAARSCTNSVRVCARSLWSEQSFSASLCLQLFKTLHFVRNCKAKTAF